MAPNGEMKRRRKPFQSRRMVQAIVAAVALHVVGFLGMNFLREVNYYVDFNRQIISCARFQ